GNLIQDNTQYYEYNAFNQLERVREQSSTGNVIEEYEYDQDGQRVMKIVVGTSGNQTHYYVDKDFVRITNSSGNYDTVYYYLGTNLIGKNASGTICYMHPDHLGSTSLVTNSAGTEDETIEYYPFGGIISTTNEEFLYTSKEKDSSNLNYYEARYYDSDGLRKFTQPDPLSYDLEYLKKYNEQVFNPQALNSFTYVMNNPYKYNDPNGLWTMQIGVSGTAGAGGQVGIGFVIGNNEGGLIPNQAGGYAYGGAGGATLGGGIEFTYSDNDYISDLKGTTVTTGGNIPVGGVEWNLPIGSSANIYNGDKEVERLKSSYSLNIGAFGEVIGFDVHGYVVKTGVLQFVGPERELTCNTEAFSQASNAIQSTDFSNRYTSSKNYFNSLAGGNKDE
ncbi:hypothetical protein K9M79_07320, partial [Candidatus Woesearchaeota archaeon]|nr:hypothetical protein [Candidatus Woesearchaeota archaeon]